MMKKLLYSLSFLVLLTVSCSDDPDPIRACNVENAMDLVWLQELIVETEEFEIGRDYSFITMGIYDSQTVFVLQNCCPLCNSVYPVYDCSGNSLGVIGSAGVPFEEITDRKVIWKSSNNSCNI
ncbi:hypothetical protein GCM10027454_07910 [Algoriphagus aestuariicola]